MLQILHSESLRKFTYYSDMYLYNKLEYYAKPEEWLIEDEYKLGDCEDYAIWMQYKLKKLNIKSRLKRLPGHMILIVNDKWIIDNKYEDIRLLR